MGINVATPSLLTPLRELVKVLGELFSWIISQTVRQLIGLQDLLNELESYFELQLVEEPFSVLAREEQPIPLLTLDFTVNQD